MDNKSLNSRCPHCGIRHQVTDHTVEHSSFTVYQLVLLVLICISFLMFIISSFIH